MFKFDPAEMLATFETHVQGFRNTGTQAYGLCPFHEDTKPSFSMELAEGLWNCHGCGEKGNFYQFCQRLSIPSPTFIRPSEKPPFKIKERYPYLDPEGNLSYEILRMDPKAFLICRTGKDGKTIWKKEGLTLIPYNLPTLIKAETVFLVEGEKCANILTALKLPATTTPFGCKAWEEHYAEWFKGKRVIILPDADKGGIRYATDDAANDLCKVAKVKIVNLPGLLEGEDVEEYFGKYGNTVASLFDLIKATPLYKPLDTIDPEIWFKSQGIEIPSIDGALPGEFKDLCKQAFKFAVESLETGVDDATHIAIDQLDEVWSKTRSKANWKAFLEALRNVVESSRKAV